MAVLDLPLHPKQLEILNDPARFKVIVAGRRFGKSHLMAVWLLMEALKKTNDRGYKLTGEHEVIYIAPTFAQAHGMFWPKIKKLAEPVIAKAMENTGILYLTNGRRIRLFGMDNPDAARGIAVSAVGFDEYADMPERAWEEILQPALMDVEGEAMFIGTPKGKNHFYELYKDAADDESGDWAAFNYTSHENPILSPKELARLTENMSSDRRMQEIEASFQAAEGALFKREWFKFDPVEPEDGVWAISVDLAGFASSGQGNRREIKRLDETAICIAKVHRGGWWVKEIIHGQWDVRETSMKILQAAKSVQCSTVGIEKGSLKNAIEVPLREVMQRFGRYLHIVPLTHGNRAKPERISWALQGKAEKGRITLNPGAWANKLVDQALDFPDPRAKDDLLDALAYIDQCAVNVSFDDWQPGKDRFKPLDNLAGY